MARDETIQADLTWIDGSFRRDTAVRVGADGRIAAIDGRTPEPVRRLERRALLPGFVNAHSHAFQRGLRGLGETFPASSGDFWTWREAMYGLVAEMDEPTLHELCGRAFREMLAAGITTVGEFHYLHHDATGSGFRFDEVVLAAAAEAGIRIVLLNAAYRTGGFDAPLAGGQRRFDTGSPAAYWAQMDRLAEAIDPATQGLGVVAHSVRAVPIDEIASMHEESRRRGMVFHVHAEEQPLEIEACRAAHGVTPLALLGRALEIDGRFTAVHLTHSTEEDLAAFLGRGANVCICPLTEANLGDGLADVPCMRRHAGHLCLGTDSNSRLCFLEEMRWLEYGQRLARRSRGVLRDVIGGVAPVLLTAATRNGARSLGLEAGVIRRGALADFVAVDLDAPALAGWTEETLLDALVFGAGNEAIAEVCVGGAWRSV